MYGPWLDIVIGTICHYAEDLYALIYISSTSYHIQVMLRKSVTDIES